MGGFTEKVDMIGHDNVGANGPAMAIHCAFPLFAKDFMNGGGIEDFPPTLCVGRNKIDWITDEDF